MPKDGPPGPKRCNSLFCALKDYSLMNTLVYCSCTIFSREIRDSDHHELKMYVLKLILGAKCITMDSQGSVSMKPLQLGRVKWEQLHKKMLEMTSFSHKILIPISHSLQRSWRSLILTETCLAQWDMNHMHCSCTLQLETGCDLNVPFFG